MADWAQDSWLRIRLRDLATEKEGSRQKGSRPIPPQTERHLLTLMDTLEAMRPRPALGADAIGTAIVEWEDHQAGYTVEIHPDGTVALYVLHHDGRDEQETLDRFDATTVGVFLRKEHGMKGTTSAGDKSETRSRGRS